jgi:hypothetical protein
MASYLNDFQDEQRAKIVALPVRVGAWMSNVDDIAGTSRDEAKEELALEKALQHVMKKTGDKSFSNDVVEFALAGKQYWPEWKANAATVLDDIPGVINLVRATLPADALKAFQKTLYFVAAVVAQAAAEKGGEDDLSREMMGAGLVQKLLDRLSVKTDMKAPDNISDKEKAALQKLADVLKG